MSHGYAWGVGLGYSNKDWWNLDVQAGYQYGNDQYKAYASTVAGDIQLYEMNIHTYAITAKIQPLQYLTLSGGYNWYMDSSPTDAYYNEGTAWGYQNVVGSTGGSHGTNLSTAASYHTVFGGGELDIGALVPTLNGLKLQAGLYDNVNQAGSVKDNGTGQDLHVYTESFVLDYKINKRFDTYFAFTNNKFVGPSTLTGWDSSLYYTDVRAIGLGVRMKF